MNESKLIDQIEENIALQMQEAKQAEQIGDLDSKWTSLLSKDVRYYINDDFSINRDALKSFRNSKAKLVIPDSPGAPPGREPLKDIFSGGRRGERRVLKELLEVLIRLGDDKILLEYPASPVGDAGIFKYKGYQYTYRWLRHIRMISLFRQHFKEMAGENFTTLDIGSGWGIFSYLMAKEMPESSNILLDFPEMLLFAHYFLGMNFPNARIATYKDLREQKQLSRKFLRQFDFILVPHFMFDKLVPGSVDLLSNVASFGEMRREWFEYYVKSDLFDSIKFFLTANRFESAPLLDPTYDTDLTVLDYPLNDFQKRRFGVCPIFSYIYERKALFFYKKRPFSSQYFEFAGIR